MTTISFFLALAAIALFGMPAAFHPIFRTAGFVPRAAASFLLGTVMLTLEGMVWSLLSVPWTVWTLAVPLGCASLAAAIVMRRRNSTAVDEVNGNPEKSPVMITATALTLGGLAFLAWQLVTTRATSPDLLFFWGVKGVKFAQAGGIDATLLGWPFFIHAHVTYPPLLPSTFAWGCLVSGEMPWIWAPTVSWIWIAATAATLGPILRFSIGTPGAAVLVAVWTVTISSSMVASNSGGNAEAPLVAYVTVACASLLVTSAKSKFSHWPIVAFGFAGAALSKNEGMISVALLSLGALARAWLERDAVSGLRTLRATLFAGLCFTLWVLFRSINNLPLVDPVRPRVLSMSFGHAATIFSAIPANLAAGTWGLSWILFIVTLVISRHRIIRALPAVALSCGLLVFATVYYLHSQDDPTWLIRWTLPRLAQPALSALVMWAGFAWFDEGATDPRQS